MVPLEIRGVQRSYTATLIESNSNVTNVINLLLLGKHCLWATEPLSNIAYNTI